MNITITPSLLHGNVSVLPSKSQLHRHLICSAFADKRTELLGVTQSRDIDATISCLRSLGASVAITPNGFAVEPIRHFPKNVTLHCLESGSTLRFMLPVIGALGIDATFLLDGRLPQRPISPLWEEMERKGCTLSWLDSRTLHCTGQLTCGEYSISGNISSQFISGLLLACTLMQGRSKISVIGKLESKPYVDMTLQALSAYGITATNLLIEDSVLRSPGSVKIEGDWSSAAYFLSANALGSDIQVAGLSTDSLQGDKVISDILLKLNQYVHIDAADIPDLVPILAVIAAGKQGAIFENVRRLRLKESDRIEAICHMLQAFGCKVEAEENVLCVHPGVFHSCTVDACNDHRIAMAAAVAAIIADGPVTILGAECIEKSYPTFWEDYQRLGGKYEQQLW